MSDPRGPVPGAALNVGTFGISQPAVSTDSAVYVGENGSCAFIALIALA